MKLINRLIFSLFVISFPLIMIAQENHPNQNTYFLHTIEKGQSLYSIASMYNVNQSDIIKLNPGCEDKIYAGQALKIPQNNTNKKGQIFHTIQPKETLYKLTVQYNISAKDICDANPGLSANNFKIGQVIVIPVIEESQDKTPNLTENVSISTSPMPAVKPKCREMHKVKRKETIYSVSREYGITENELAIANPELKSGMKKGMFLCIPYPSEKNSVSQKPLETTNVPNDTQLFDNNKEKSKRLSTIKAAVILPFTSGETHKMVEYYEGFLMAVDSLKKTGVSIELFVYDSGNENTSIKPILAKREMKDMDIIFGPLYSEHTRKLSDFSKKNNIHLVIPFSSKDSEVFNNPSIYQINTPQSYLYSEVYEHFIRKFKDANVIIIESNNTDKEKAEFIKGLKYELNINQITCKTVKDDASQTTLKGLLSPIKENIFILTSGSNVALIKSLPKLTILVRENPDYKIHLFGYPEWQTYTKDHLASFYELDTYFYSSFYTNNLFPQTIDFTSAYRKWYGKDMMNSYPKFGMLGFDTGYFFLKALSQYGSTFENHLTDMNVIPIQTGFKFDRVNNWGGFINKKVFFVHFTKDFELIKLDFE